MKTTHRLLIPVVQVQLPFDGEKQNVKIVKGWKGIIRQNASFQAGKYEASSFKTDSGLLRKYLKGRNSEKAWRVHSIADQRTISLLIRK